MPLMLAFLNNQGWYDQRKPKIQCYAEDTALNSVLNKLEIGVKSNMNN